METASDLSKKLVGYNEQLVQVATLLAADSTNPQFLKLHKDLKEVIRLTEKMLAMHTKPAAPVVAAAPPAVRMMPSAAEVQVVAPVVAPPPKKATTASTRPGKCDSVKSPMRVCGCVCVRTPSRPSPLLSPRRWDSAGTVGIYSCETISKTKGRLRGDSERRRPREEEAAQCSRFRGWLCGWCTM
jgi:hypothetical protein